MGHVVTGAGTNCHRKIKKIAGSGIYSSIDIASIKETLVKQSTVIQWYTCPMLGRENKILLKLFFWPVDGKGSVITVFSTVCRQLSFLSGKKRTFLPLIDNLLRKNDVSTVSSSQSSSIILPT